MALIFHIESASYDGMTLDGSMWRSQSIRQDQWEKEIGRWLPTSVNAPAIAD